MDKLILGAFIGLVVGFWGTVVYVAFHFIAKFW